jgi:hypothetical protein
MSTGLRWPWARLVLCVIAIFGGLGGLLSDFSETHLLNPNWPPHARFHNAQTMSMGMLLAALTLLFAWRRMGDARLQILATGAFGSLYWLSISCAQFFPGVGFFDPEFSEREKIMIGAHRLTQGEMGVVLVAIAFFVTWWEWRRLGRAQPTA